MVDSIKITALQDIGANIMYTTLVPVVDMSGTPTTKKANLQTVGNLILNGAGGSYFPRAAQATLALSVANAAQPNITSVGTLTTLTVSGNLNASNVVANFYFGDGGFLTNVAGGGSNYSNSNVAAYLPTYTGNVSANWILADYVSGNASPLTNIPGANVTGQVPYAAVANSVALANVSGLGNIAVVNLDGNASNVLRGNGSWGPANSSYSNTNVANYLPTYTGTVGANRISSNALSGSNVEINANGAVYTFGQGGAVYWPAPLGNIWAVEPNEFGEFEIKSTTNVVISTDINNSNAHFTFASDGAVYCPANANFEGTRLNVGPGSANVPLATNPTLVVTDTGLEFIQAALINQSPNGSSDYAAYGADSDETQGFADLGFSGHNFNDPNYTITNPGDGYVLSQGYANGIGGALVLATGQYGNVPDIVFATGGYLSNNEFARIDHANNVFHLTRANSGIQFADGSIQTTAGGLPLANGTSYFDIPAADGSAVITANGTYTWTFEPDGLFTAPSNGIFSGNVIALGNGAYDLAVGLNNPTLVISDSGDAFIQAAINNVSDIGSADWVAYGHHGNDAGGWADMGFASSFFSDPNYTITGPGDGYVFVQGYPVGQAPAVGGGSLVLATGTEGLTKDIVFATGGFLASNEFARIDHANDLFHLTRTGSAIKFQDGTIQNTAAVSNPFDQDLNTTDNVTFANITSTDAIRFSNSGNIVGALGYAPTFVSIEGYGSNSVNVTTNDVYTWTFNSIPMITLPNNQGYIGAGVDNQLRIYNDQNAGFMQLGWQDGAVLTPNANIASNVTLNSSGVTITTTADTYTTTNDWVFGANGLTTLPDGAIIDTLGNIFEVRAVENVNFEANAVVNIYTDTGNAAYQWQFGDDGNLTLPGNTIAINFANNSPAFGNMVEWTTAPVSNTSAGTAGQAAYDSGGNLFVCVAANTWAKFAGTTSW